MKPTIGIATVIACTAVLAPTTALCVTVPVAEYAYGAWSGSHSRKPAEVLVRLCWAWPLAIAVTFTATTVVRRWWERRRTRQERVAEVSPWENV